MINVNTHENMGKKEEKGLFFRMNIEKPRVIRYEEETFSSTYQ
jgi:hypothetical protein